VVPDAIPLSTAGAILDGRPTRIHFRCDRQGRTRPRSPRRPMAPENVARGRLDLRFVRPHHRHRIPPRQRLLRLLWHPSSPPHLHPVPRSHRCRNAPGHRTTKGRSQKAEGRMGRRGEAG
jgi:hypothetical protein